MQIWANGFLWQRTRWWVIRYLLLGSIYFHGAFICFMLSELMLHLPLCSCAKECTHPCEFMWITTCIIKQGLWCEWSQAADKGYHHHPLVENYKPTAQLVSVSQRSEVGEGALCTAVLWCQCQHHVCHILMVWVACVPLLLLPDLG